MRLIDADLLMEKHGLNNATKYGNKDAEQQAHSYSTLMLYEIADIIEDAPTVEAKEVVHGKWIKSQSMPRSAKCSECKCWITKHSVNELWFRYCPHCGADMRTSAE